MKKFKIQTLLLSTMALVFISTFTMTLTSCGDDEPEATSLYQQWELKDFAKIYAGEEAEDGTKFTDEFNAIVVDFSQKGKVITLVRKKSDGKWYTMVEMNIIVKEISSLNGIVFEIDPDDGEEYPLMSYLINPNNNTLVTTLPEFEGEVLTHVFKPTKGIKSAGKVDEKWR